MAGRIMHLYLDADLRGRQPSLAKYAKEKSGHRVDHLEPGELMVFINRKGTKIAVIGGVNERDSLGVLGYYSSPTGRIDPMSIRYIPEAMGASGRLDMAEATRKALIDRFKKKGREYRVDDVIVRRSRSTENRVGA